MIHIHGFDWAFYAKTVMPAFARWLIGDDEQEIYQLYSGTLHALEERFVPETMQPLCAWPRACDFVHQLPRGPFARREYQKLCVAEQFLLLSDRYVYRHPPRLYRESEALRTIWGATIQQYCLPWQQSIQEVREVYPAEQTALSNEFPMARTELLDLLQTAGLNELVEEVNEYISTREKEKSPQTLADTPEEPVEDEDGRGSGGPRGIFIGQHPMTLHLRGWLGTQSIRTMVLFEAPHRIEPMLRACAEALGADRRAAVCRELTKTYEEVRRGTLAELADWAADGVRGEITVVIAGAGEARELETEELVGMVEREVSAGLSKKDAIALVAASTGTPKRTVFEAYHSR